MALQSTQQSYSNHIAVIQQPFRNWPRRHGELLADFLAMPSARTAQLEDAHVAALRIYTTAAFKVLRWPQWIDR